MIAKEKSEAHEEILPGLSFRNGGEYVPRVEDLTRDPFCELQEVFKLAEESDPHMEGFARAYSENLDAARRAFERVFLHVRKIQGPSAILRSHNVYAEIFRSQHRLFPGVLELDDYINLPLIYALDDTSRMASHATRSKPSRKFAESVLRGLDALSSTGDLDSLRKLPETKIPLPRYFRGTPRAFVSGIGNASAAFNVNTCIPGLVVHVGLENTVAMNASIHLATAEQIGNYRKPALL